jgi:hypothetical protein
MASIISPTEPPPDDDPEDTEEAIIENFEVFLLGLEEASEAQQENPYGRQLSEDSFLSILHVASKCISKREGKGLVSAIPSEEFI